MEKEINKTKYYKLWIKLMKYGKKLGCHQKPERSFFFHGYQFPVCARCTGVIISGIISIPCFFIYRVSILTCVIFCIIMFSDWYIQYIKFKKSTNIRRLITGLLGGYGVSTIEWYIIYYFLFWIRHL